MKSFIKALLTTNLIVQETLNIINWSILLNLSNWCKCFSPSPTFCLSSRSLFISEHPLGLQFFGVPRQALSNDRMLKNSAGSLLFWCPCYSGRPQGMFFSQLQEGCFTSPAVHSTAMARWQYGEVASLTIVTSLGTTQRSSQTARYSKKQTIINPKPLAFLGWLWWAQSQKKDKTTDGSRINLYVHIHMDTYKYIHMYTYIDIHIYIYICIYNIILYYIYMYVLYVYMWLVRDFPVHSNEYTKKHCTFSRTKRACCHSPERLQACMAWRKLFSPGLIPFGVSSPTSHFKRPFKICKVLSHWRPFTQAFIKVLYVTRSGSKLRRRNLLSKK